MEYLLSKEQLIAKFGVPDFVLKTQRQIAKDFMIVSFKMDPKFESEEFNYDQIKNEVACQLVEVMKLGETTLLQLLYQIDIPQSKFLNLISEVDFVQQMSDMIIRREAYKVYLRSKF